MPLGDSLTSSLDGQASYRYFLWQKLQAAGYNVDFVGTLWGVGEGVSGVYPNFDQNHEGHPGATTDDVLQGVTYWATVTQPDVVLLLIGGNDFDHGQTPSHAVANTHRIVTALRTVNPKVAVLVGMLPPMSDQRGKDQAYNSILVNNAPRWSKRGSPVRIVNLWSYFYTKRDTVDGQHPSESGEKKFANRFFRSLGPILKRYGQ